MTQKWKQHQKLSRTQKIIHPKQMMFFMNFCCDSPTTTDINLEMLSGGQTITYGEYDIRGIVHTEKTTVSYKDN